MDRLVRATPSNGSPPLARRGLADRVHDALMLRLTSARAERTMQSAWSRSGTTAHLRSRGEDG